jgi:hypothetical protein
LENARTAVMEDLGEWIPEVPLSFMLDNIIPPPRHDVQVVKEVLEKEGCFQRQRWKTFRKDPADTKYLEDKTFEPLEPLFSQIMSSACTSDADTGVGGGGEEATGNEEPGQGEDEVTLQETGKGEKKGKKKPKAKARAASRSTGKGKGKERATAADSQHLLFVNNPNYAPSSERSNKTRPDGFFARKSTYEDPTPKDANAPVPLHYWIDIAVSSEYKKGAGADDVHDVSFYSIMGRACAVISLSMQNTRKVLWSMQHIMRCDPCRRFTFGITVENADMRIWFCCRSTVLVSQSFNFISVSRKLCV